MGVGHHNGTYIEVVRRHRGDHKTPRIGKDHGPVAAQRIARGTGGGGHNESIGPVGIQKLAVEIGVDLDHGRHIALVDGKLIHTTSVPVGSLNFYQQYVSNVLPNDAEQNLMRAHARTIFSNIVWLENKMIDHIIGIGGTSRAMVKMNKVLDFEKNTSLSYNTISNISRLSPAHAQDIIKGAPDGLITLVPCAILIDELMQYVHATTFTASNASL